MNIYIYIHNPYKCPYKCVPGVVNLLIGAPFHSLDIPLHSRTLTAKVATLPVMAMASPACRSWRRQQGTRGRERGSSSNQWLFLVPLKGGIGSIFDPPEGKDYKWYISGIYCQLGDYMLPTTFLGEPETTIDPTIPTHGFFRGKLASFQKWVVVTPQISIASKLPLLHIGPGFIGVRTLHGNGWVTLSYPVYVRLSII